MLAVFTVNTTVDSVDVNPGDGKALDANGLTSLRAAIMEADAEAGPTTIVVPAGTYGLTIAGSQNSSAASGDLDLTTSMTIEGAGPGATIIDAHNLGDRVFDDPGGPLAITLEGLTISGGTAFNSLGNYSPEAYGGALRVGAGSNVTIANCVFSGDRSPSENSAGTLVDGMGGAISSDGNLNISDSVFEQNYASNSGGALFLYGAPTASVTIQDTTFDGNNAIQGGGAIDSDADLTIAGCTFSNNIATSAAHNSGQGGAIENGWNLNLTNSTISGNQAAFGAAMYSDNSNTNYTTTVAIQSSTIADNTSYHETGGIYQFSGQADKIENSIIGPNSAYSDPDVLGPFTSLGHNIIANTTGGTGFGAVGDQLNVDPQLGALAYNGGPTKTQALLAGSPAIDAANPATAPATDQRGAARPVGNGPDIGAYEYGGVVSGPPVAVNDSYSVNENTALSVAASGVLSNDNGGNIATLAAALVSGPSNGSLTLNANGSFVYTPNAGFSGSDTFSYDDVQGTLTSAPATVTITVVPVPSAANDSFTVNENNSLTVAAPGALANDTAVNSSPLSAVLLSGPSHGSLSFKADGSFVYMPAVNFSGTDSFTYDDTEGAVSSNVATVTITVNQMPVAVADSYAVNENSSLTVGAASGVLANDIPLDNTPLAASVVSGPANGSLVLNSDGSFVYTPNAGFYGTDSFLYDDTEGTLTSNPTGVTITVNRIPTAVNDSYSTNENTPLVVSASGITSLTMSSQSGDWVGQGQNYNFTPATGTFSVTAQSNDDTLTFSYQDKSPTQWWTVELAAPNGGALVPGTYPNAARYPFQAYTQPGLDVSGDGRGSNTLTGSFTVTQATYGVGGNVISFDATFVQYGDGSTAALTGEIKYNAAPAIAGVLLNDVPANSTPLSAVLVNGPSHGTVSLNANGTFTYTPAANFYGTDSFTYDDAEASLTSNAATVSVTVNQTPVAVPDSYAIDENSSLTVNAAAGVLANDIPINGDALTASVVGGPAHGSLTLNADGSFIYTPAVNFNGSDSFTYDDTQDGITSSPGTVTITINPVPVAINDDFTTNENTPLAEAVTSLAMSSQPGDFIGLGQNYNFTQATGKFSVSSTATDNELQFYYSDNGNSVNSWTVDFVAPQGATLVPGTYNNAARAFFQAASQPGLDVSGDGRGSNTLTGSFVIKEADYDSAGNVLRFDATFVQYSDNATAPLTGEIKYNASSGIGGVLLNDLPANSTPLTSVLVSGPSHGSVTLNANGTFTYTPAIEFYGSDSFTYQDIEGNQTSNIGTVNLTVNFVDTAPSFTGGANQSIPEGSGAQTVTNWASNISAGPPDESGQILTFDTSTNNNALFSVLPAIDPSTGTLTYTPAPGAVGTAVVTVTLHDNGGTANGGVDTSAPRYFGITVYNVPPAVSLGGNVTINEGGNLSTTGSFTDPGIETWTATVDYGDGAGPQPLTLNADKSFNLSHTYAEDGSYTVTISVADSNNGVGTSSFIVTVNEVAPTATLSNGGPVEEGSPATVSFGNPFSPSQADTNAGFHYDFALNESSLTTNYAAAGTATSASFTFSEQGTYTVWGRILDSDNAWTDYSTTITVNDVAPMASLTNSGQVNEGSAATVTFSNPFSPSQADTGAGFHYDFSTNESNLTTSYATAGTATSALFTFSEQGTYTVWGRILASDGAWTDYPTTITVNDVAPTGSFANSGSVSEGSAATVSFSNPFSPSQADTNAGFHFSFSSNAAGLATAYKSAGTASSTSLSFTADGTYTVWGRIIAQDGAYSTYSTAITVTEAPPTATVSGPTLSVPGQPQTFTFSAMDPEPVTPATFTYVINWGDGSTPLTVAGSSSIAQTHVFTAAGSYSVTVTATDGDGGTSASSKLGVSVPVASLESGNLFVGGTTGNDTIVVAPSDLKGDLKVTVNGASYGPFHPTGQLVVYAQAGDDHVQLQSASIQGKTVYVTAPAVLFGGDGNNTLDARGSTANDVLVGGPGNDALYGGRARNLLIGGAGSDTLNGGNADDLLIAGTTDFDSNLAALNAIMAEWGSSDGYSVRVSKLTGATSGGLNGSFFLTASTVHDDGAVDYLYGNGGQDWFFYHPGSDVLKDKKGNEIATTI